MQHSPENAELWDVDGRRYIDFGTGIAVLNTGHLHPAREGGGPAAAEPSRHTCFMSRPMRPTSVSLAQTERAHARQDSAKNASRDDGRRGRRKRHQDRPQGDRAVRPSSASAARSMAAPLLAMALTGKVVPYKKGFGPFPAEVYHAPFPKSLHGVDAAKAMAGLQQLFLKKSIPRGWQRSSSSRFRARVASTLRRRVPEAIAGAVRPAWASC